MRTIIGPCTIGARMKGLPELNGDPCLCGDVTTWHPRCYQGLTQKQIDAKYKRVFAKLRRKHREAMKRLASETIAKAAA